MRGTVRTRRSRSILAVYCILVGLFALLPTLIVVPMSFSSVRSLQFPPPGWSTRWYEEFFTNPEWREAALTSVRVGGVAALLATILGTMAAIALVNSRRRWTVAARTFLVAPMIVPLVVTGVGVYYVFLRWQLTETFVGFVVAHTVLAIPIVVITVGASLQSFDMQLVQASKSLGAGPLATFRTVTLPLILPGVLAGALFAFLISFDEAVVSLFLSGPTMQTLPIKIFQSVTTSLDPTVAAASTVLLGLTTLALLVLGMLTYLRDKAEAHD
ncbi:ABC transporter permease [Nocardioides panacisoli]|uniref:ABC transporter permease n=1 Tax=Nocardioides panacisoli TaxID=627624 RepID=UPI001C62CB5C|nr:ABC transporter permease [Nocardioides panacisoli]QYJ03530.1 ABC transporter permease [Nocardioides panacisoli]